MYSHLTLVFVFNGVAKSQGNIIQILWESTA